jgi:hypothetical protein
MSEHWGENKPMGFDINSGRMGSNNVAIDISLLKGL